MILFISSAVFTEDAPGERIISGTISLPAGQNSESYRYTLFPNTYGSGYQVNYLRTGDLPGYASSAYYSTGGMTDKTHASVIDLSAGDRPGICLKLVPAGKK